ncbi:uncharacterized protein LOC141851700 [Brevipalpus obovatus]|uniref:uncharacterized protein LOC141851700 n=1 Tax=Brevipalpus obovatus TaxID=246614 RepID=UPI003D9E6BAE
MLQFFGWLLERAHDDSLAEFFHVSALICSLLMTLYGKFLGSRPEARAVIDKIAFKIRTPLAACFRALSPQALSFFRLLCWSVIAGRFFVFFVDIIIGIIQKVTGTLKTENTVE